MRRREFITLLGAAAVTPSVLWPTAARAQQAKLPVIGVLVLGNPDPTPFLAALRQGLQAAGYSEGRNLRLEIRSADRQPDRLRGAAAELVGLKVDVLVVYQTPAALAARDATKDVPIVMVGVGDPVATGLIASLSRPGGNITGNTAIGAEMVMKNVELIREVTPSAQRIAILLNKTDPFSRPYLAHTETATQRLGIRLDPVWATPSEDLDAPLENVRAQQADFVVVQPSLLRPHVIDLITKYRLPSLSGSRQLPFGGGLMSYGGFAPAQFREAAVYVDRILKGARPADLPVAQPTRFELVLNLKTAKALDLDLPPTLLARADEVIE